MPRKPDLARLARKRYEMLLKRRAEIDAELAELTRIIAAVTPPPESTKRGAS